MQSQQCWNVISHSPGLISIVWRRKECPQKTQQDFFYGCRKKQEGIQSEHWSELFDLLCLHVLSFKVMVDRVGERVALSPNQSVNYVDGKKNTLLPLFIAFNTTRLSLQYSDKWPDQKVPSGVAQCARKHDNHVLSWKGTIEGYGALSVEKPHQSLLYGVIPEVRTWWSGLSVTVPVEKTWCGVFYGGQWRKKDEAPPVVNFQGMKHDGVPTLLPYQCRKCNAVPSTLTFQERKHH